MYNFSAGLRRTALLDVRTLFLITLCLVAPGAATRSPNIALIMTDDQGYGHLGVRGNPKIQTPNLNRLGRESVRFDPKPELLAFPPDFPTTENSFLFVSAFSACSSLRSLR